MRVFVVSIYKGWQNTIALEQGTRRGQIESEETFLTLIDTFWINNIGMQDCLDPFCQSGWKMDMKKMGFLRTNWQRIQFRAADLLDLTVKGISACDYWTKKVVSNGQPHNKRERPLRLRRAIEKWLSFIVMCTLSFNLLTQRRYAHHSFQQM